MALLDDRGRLFGRVNLLDAAIGLFVFAIVPAAYASWAFFRTPPPVIEAVIPAVIAPGQADLPIELRGRHLRPFLHAGIGNSPAPFLFDSSERAQLRLTASWTANGWKADGVPLKAGAPFTLTAPTYVLRGEILGISPTNAGK